METIPVPLQSSLGRAVPAEPQCMGRMQPGAALGWPGGHSPCPAAPPLKQCQGALQAGTALLALKGCDPFCLSGGQSSSIHCVAPVPGAAGRAGAEL